MAEIDDLADVLDEPQRRVWAGVAEYAHEIGGCLMGGTAVAVHLRHRRSEDLDVMTSRDFSDPSFDQAKPSALAHLRERAVALGAEAARHYSLAAGPQPAPSAAHRRPQPVADIDDEPQRDSSGGGGGRPAANIRPAADSDPRMHS